jgi:hypothetical protein
MGWSMTDLAEVALDFARECLGWPEAHHENDNVFFYRWEGNVLKQVDYLYFTDLNAVMDAVNTWRRSAKVWVSIHTVASDIGNWDVEAGRKGQRTSLCRYVTDDLCLAVLSACVSANRKMKEAV